MKHCYKLLVAYDGTAYQGWQAQTPMDKTIAGTLQKSFQSIFKMPMTLRGVSRTDAGVHAMGQVVRVRTDLDLDPAKIEFAWNNRLPSDIIVRQVERVPTAYRLQEGIVEKVYLYHFFTSRPTPFQSRYGWYVQYPVDLEKLQKCLQLLVGTHDFRSFCTGDDWDDTVRTVNSITVNQFPEKKLVQIVVKGPRFLRYMIRRIVGACIHVASVNKLDATEIEATLLRKNPEHCLPNAPAQGLMLYKIKYQEDQVDASEFVFQVF